MTRAAKARTRRAKDEAPSATRVCRHRPRPRHPPPRWVLDWFRFAGVDMNFTRQDLIEPRDLGLVPAADNLAGLALLMVLDALADGDRAFNVGVVQGHIPAPLLGLALNTERFKRFGWFVSYPHNKVLRTPLDLMRAEGADVPERVPLEVADWFGPLSWQGVNRHPETLVGHLRGLAMLMCAEVLADEQREVRIPDFTAALPKARPDDLSPLRYSGWVMPIDFGAGYRILRTPGDMLAEKRKAERQAEVNRARVELETARSAVASLENQLRMLDEQRAAASAALAEQKAKAGALARAVEGGGA